MAAELFVPTLDSKLWTNVVIIDIRLCSAAYHSRATSRLNLMQTGRKADS